MSLSPIPPLERLAPPAAPSYSYSTEAPPAAEGAFDRLLHRVLGGANAADAQAGQAVQALATGEADDVHTAALAVAQADISFRLALTVRNRLLEAYQEIIRMQV